MIKIGVAGAYGAFGLKHLDAVANIKDAEVTAIFGPNKDKIESLASERKIPKACSNYDDFLSQDIDAVILSSIAAGVRRTTGFFLYSILPFLFFLIFSLLSFAVKEMAVLQFENKWARTATSKCVTLCV